MIGNGEQVHVYGESGDSDGRESLGTSGGLMEKWQGRNGHNVWDWGRI